MEIVINVISVIVKTIFLITIIIYAYVSFLLAFYFSYKINKRGDWWNYTEKKNEELYIILLILTIGLLLR